MRLLKSLNRKVQQSDSGATDAPQKRFTFGIYYYSEAAAAEPAAVAPGGESARSQHSFHPLRRP